MIYGQYIEELGRICSDRNFSMRSIGTVGKKNRYSLYAIEIPAVGKEEGTVCIAAGIHGDEMSGCLGILRFLEKYTKEDYSGIKYIIFPVLNPFGFNFHKRTDERGTDLNHTFFDKDNPVRQLISSYMKGKEIDVAISFHEDDELMDGYMYIYGENKHDELYDEARKIIRKVMPLSKNNNLYGNGAERGVIFNVKDDSFEEWMHEKWAHHVLCVEVPDQLKDPEKLVEKILHKILDINLKRN